MGGLTGAYVGGLTGDFVGATYLMQTSSVVDL